MASILDGVLNDPTPKENGAWPHDQRYANVCACGRHYFGPKHAPSCWECQSPDGRAWWLSKFAAAE